MSDDESYSGRTVDSKDIKGFDKVFKFYRFIDSLPSSLITDEDEKKIAYLYNQLSAYDKKPLTYGRILKSNLKGRFAGNKSGHVGEQQIQVFSAMKFCYPFKSFHRVFVRPTIKSPICFKWPINFTLHACSLALQLN